MTAVPMESFWMPFSFNRSFKSEPRMLVSASGMNYTDDSGRKVLDSTSGLWCCNAGHCRTEIADAIGRAAKTLDFAPTFHMGHPAVFQLAEKLATNFFPKGLSSIFFTNSGSEAADSALKIALAYHKVRGKGGKTRLIGRERGYHGTNMAGISVGGISKNRSWFNNLLSQVDHITHTHDLSRNAFSRGAPEHGGIECADHLLRLIGLHDASTIAAVMIEPVAGSTGVLPPPVGYLRRLREICDAHDILLIFDEVITAFGRLGARTAAEFFDVKPDMITFAKGVTSGAAPMGGVAVRGDIYKTFVDAAGDSEIDFFHGYTYSGHPLAAAAGLAAMDLYEREGLFTRAAEMHTLWEDSLHSLKGLPNIIDIRNIGMMGAIEFAPREGAPGGARAYDIFNRCFHEKSMLSRCAGDVIAVSPPLIATESDLSRIFDNLREVIKTAQ